jgi:GTP-binding protein EngB required for normal cell division
MPSAPVDDLLRTPPGAKYRHRQVLAEALDDAAQVRGVDAAALHWLSQKVYEETFNLVVAGQFKRGKSSVINALLGDRILPVGVVPLTSVVTVIRSGSSAKARVEFLDGRRTDLALGSLSDYVTERGNPKNSKGVRQVVIEHPSAWLAEGLRLIDTPGIGSVYEHNTDVTQQYLPQADAVLLVASVEQPVSRAELEFLGSIRQYADKSFCLLNKIDYLNREELPEALSFAREAVRQALGIEVPLFPVSARAALDSKLALGMPSDGSGFPEFERALRRFMSDEKREVWIRSVSHALRRILSHARFALELEAKVLGTPLAEIEGKVVAFEAKRRELELALFEYQVLMDAGARALMREEIEPALEEFKAREQERVAALVEEWGTESRALSARKLDALLERSSSQAIRSAYDSWLLGEDRAASAAFESLCERFWSEMQSSVDELVRYSSELFSLQFERVPDDSRWTPESGFYYKFWYEPAGLAMLSTSLVSMLPRPLSTRLIVRRRKARARELVEMQAGRLRYDFEQRVQKSALDVRQRMVGRIEATLAALAAAIENGTTAQRQGTEHVAAGMNRIQSARQAIAVIEARMQTLEAER